MSAFNYDFPDNFIYISHLTLGDMKGIWFRIPEDPDSIQDTMNSTFAETNALSRSAPVFTYSYSGPREIEIKLDLHRDLLQDVNVGWSNAKSAFNDFEYEDYLDLLLRALQSIAVPRYNLTNKAVEPPLVMVKFGEEVFIKGIVNGGVNVTYEKPLIEGKGGVKKYQKVMVAFKVYETDPYDASSVFTNGSFRGLTRAMKKGLTSLEGK